MTVKDEQLKAFLIDAGLVSEKDIEEISKTQKGKDTSLGKNLVSAGKIAEDDLRRTEAYILGIPFVSLKGEKIPFEVLSLIPEPIARRNNIVAFKKIPKALFSSDVNHTIYRMILKFMYICKNHTQFSYRNPCVVLILVGPRLA